MIAAKESEGIYLASFSQLAKTLAGQGPAWLHQIRAAAMDSFAELGFPDTHVEEWKYTNIAPLLSTPFQPARLRQTAAIADRLRRLPLANLGCGRLVFVNGHYAPQLSTPEALPQGVKAGSLRSALAADVTSLQEHLARHADYKDHAFVALNTAFLEDGAFIEIPKGLVLKQPIFLLFVSDRDGEATVSYPRNLILAGRESQAAVIEAYVGVTDEVYFTNTVTELVVGESAVLNHHKVQQESDAAFHYGRIQIQQDRSKERLDAFCRVGRRADAGRNSRCAGGRGSRSHAPWPLCDHGPATRGQPHRPGPRQTPLQQPRGL